MSVMSGLAAFTPQIARGRTFGVVTNQTGVDADFHSIARVVAAAGGRIGALFGGEHGYAGVEAEGAAVGNGGEGSVPVYSLYRPDDHDSYAPPPGSLDGLDALIFDIQDVGLRYYTYPSTLGILLERVELPIYVVDRPNPLGGVEIEGARLDPAFASFVGRYPTPVRHGLTLGELATYINTEFLDHRADLHILPMMGWTRATTWEETGLAWIAPSPNLPTLAAVRLYGGTCLLEGTNVSVGRGTTQPFELIGAPYITRPDALAAALNDLNRPDVRFRAAHFKPQSGLHASDACGGVQLHITDPSVTPKQIVRTGLLIVKTLADMYPDAFAWRPAHFDRLIGSDIPRRSITEGGDLAALFEGWDSDESDFAAARQPYLLYV